MPWWENFDVADFDEGCFEPEPVTCKFCGQEGFRWDSRWVDGVLRNVLVDGRGKYHNCRSASPTEFKDYSDVVPETSSTTVAHRSDNRPGLATESRKQAKSRSATDLQSRSKRAPSSRSQAT